MNVKRVLFALCAIFATTPVFAQSALFEDMAGRGLIRYSGPSPYNYSGYGYRYESQFVRDRRMRRQPGDPMFNNEERCGITGLALGALAASALGGNGLEVLAGGAAGGAINSGRCAKRDRENFEASIGNPILECDYTYIEGTNASGNNRAVHKKDCSGRGPERLPTGRTNAIPDPGVATYDHSQFDVVPAPVDPVTLLPPNEQAPVLTLRRIAGAEELLRSLPENERNALIEGYVPRTERAEPANAVGAMTPEEQALVLANRDRLEAERLFRGLSEEEKQRFVQRMAEEGREARPTQGPASRDPNDPNPPFILPVRPE